MKRIQINGNALVIEQEVELWLKIDLLWLKHSIMNVFHEMNSIFSNEMNAISLSADDSINDKMNEVMINYDLITNNKADSTTKRTRNEANSNKSNTQAYKANHIHFQMKVK